MIRAAHAEGILDAGGGHAMAAGFSIRRSRLSDFGAFLSSRLATGPRLAKVRELVADAALSTPGAGLPLLESIERVGPFGAGNPEPLFQFPDMLIV